MFRYTFLTLFATTILSTSCSESVHDYFEKRTEITRLELRHMLGGNVNLTDKESVVNNCFMKQKNEEINYSIEHPEYFNFTHHFFEYKDKMRRRKLYKMIQKMPKGAALHVHDMSLLGPDYIMNLTFIDNLYVCFGKTLLLIFSNGKNLSSNCDWRLMSEARSSSGNVSKFDKELRDHFTIVVDNPDVVYPTIKETWTKLRDYFTTVFQILTYRPVWEQYFFDALKKYREDNIMYVETRSVLPPLYELDGTLNSQIVTAKAYKKTIARFMKTYPDFVGAKIIFAPSRHVDRTTVTQYIELAKEIKAEMPDIFAGFDLVGQEDLGEPLVDFIPELLNASKDFNYFFHAGETNWFGTSTDENLLDAVLLGTKRIGHAYALAKHPLLIREVKKKKICLEVNVISNCVLSLVRDVRNHPVSLFLANNLPIVVSSDDPGAWEAEPLSDDFYVTFLGASSLASDLKLLKTLALNSMQYSALDDVRTSEAIDLFNARWEKYIDEFDCNSF